MYIVMLNISLHGKQNTSKVLINKLLHYMSASNYYTDIQTNAYAN